MPPPTIYGKLTDLFQYPDENYLERAAECFRAMSLEQAEAAKQLGEFCEAIRGTSTDELQELFTRTFDLNPACSLEIGWHLYGEEYQRGEFLVKMRQQLRARGIQESTELPDHLTHALALLDGMESGEAAVFAGEYLLPAIDKMRRNWNQNRNAFALLLDVAFVLLNSRYAYDPARHPMRVPELRVLQ